MTKLDKKIYEKINEKIITSNLEDFGKLELPNLHRQCQYAGNVS
jgi:hypothetical protein